MNTKLNTRYGFTIVELLIVVVVIAILAAITVVSYNGITSRAKDVAIASTVDTLTKKIEIKRISTGKYTLTNAASTYTTSAIYNWYDIANLAPKVAIYTIETTPGGDVSFWNSAAAKEMVHMYISEPALAPHSVSIASWSIEKAQYQFVQMIDNGTVLRSSDTNPCWGCD